MFTIENFLFPPSESLDFAIRNFNELSNIHRDKWILVFRGQIYMVTPSLNEITEKVFDLEFPFGEYVYFQATGDSRNCPGVDAGYKTGIVDGE